MNSKGDLTDKLKRVSLVLGFAFLIVSMFLSYDGFDGSVNGRNTSYEIVAIIIGIILALGVSVLQFIFSSDVFELNTTLKIIGIASYAYSIYTNQLGAENLLSMEKGMSWIVALFLDISAEPMIAWGMGESLIGDLFGNAGKAFWGVKTRSTGNQQKSYTSNQQKKVSTPMGYRPSHRSPQTSISKGNKDTRDKLREYIKNNRGVAAMDSVQSSLPEEDDDELPAFMKD